VKLVSDVAKCGCGKCLARQELKKENTRGGGGRLFPCCKKGGVGYLRILGTRNEWNRGTRPNQLPRIKLTSGKGEKKFNPLPERNKPCTVGCSLRNDTNEALCHWREGTRWEGEWGEEGGRKQGLKTSAVESGEKRSNDEKHWSESQATQGGFIPIQLGKRSFQGPNLRICLSRG